MAGPDSRALSVLSVKLHTYSLTALTHLFNMQLEALLKADLIKYIYHIRLGPEIREISVGITWAPLPATPKANTT